MKKLVSSFMIASLILTGCSGKSGFASLDSSSSTDSGSAHNDGQNNNNNGGGDVPTWDKVDLEGYPSAGNDKGRLVIKIDKPNQSLILILPIPAFAFLPFFTKTEIPDLEGAYFTSYQQGDSNLLAISIPLKHVIK